MATTLGWLKKFIVFTKLPFFAFNPFEFVPSKEKLCLSIFVPLTFRPPLPLLVGFNICLHFPSFHFGCSVGVGDSTCFGACLGPSEETSMAKETFEVVAEMIGIGWGVSLKKSFYLGAGTYTFFYCIGHQTCIQVPYHVKIYTYLHGNIFQNC